MKENGQDKTKTFTYHSGGWDDVTDLAINCDIAKRNANRFFCVWTLHGDCKIASDSKETLSNKFLTKFRFRL